MFKYTSGEFLILLLSVVLRVPVITLLDMEAVGKDTVFVPSVMFILVTSVELIGLVNVTEIVPFPL